MLYRGGTWSPFCFFEAQGALVMMGVWAYIVGLALAGLLIYKFVPSK